MNLPNDPSLHRALIGRRVVLCVADAWRPVGTQGTIRALAASHLTRCLYIEWDTNRRGWGVPVLTNIDPLELLP